MSNAADAFNGPVVRTVNGESVTFARLLMPEYGTVEEQVRVKKRETAKLLLDLSGVTNANDRYAFMERVMLADVTPAEVDMLLRTKAGAHNALVLSLGKAGRDPTAITPVIEAMDFPQASFLARVLLGFTEDVADHPTTAGAGTGPGTPSESGSTAPASATPQA
jgi:hypothetical protein